MNVTMLIIAVVASAFLVPSPALADTVKAPDLKIFLSPRAP